MRRGGVVAEQEVTLAAHDDQPGALVGGEVARLVVHGVQQALQARVVFLRLGVSGRGDDADFAALAQEAQETRDGGVVGCEAGAVIVEGDVSVEGDEIDVGAADEAEQLCGV